MAAAASASTGSERKAAQAAFSNFSFYQGLNGTDFVAFYEAAQGLNRFGNVRHETNERSVMELSRRDFLKAASAVPIAASLPAFGYEGEAKMMGEWSDDAAGLPRYTYLGPVPFPLTSDEIPREYLPEDPFFLIGNYRFTLF